MVTPDVLAMATSLGDVLGFIGNLVTLFVLVVLAGALAFAGVVIYDACFGAEAVEQRHKQSLTKRLHDTDAHLAREHRTARQAMNRAAGQDWRNTLE